MIIRDSRVAMAAHDEQQVRAERTQSLRVRTGGGRASAPAADRLELSGTEPVEALSDPLETDPKLRLLIDLIERMTGFKIRTVSLRDFRTSASSQASASQATATQSAGWG